MAYKHDVFLSYPTDETHDDWVNKLFLKPFRFSLREALGREPSIFNAGQSIDQGDFWLQTLRTALGRSRVLIPTWSCAYFMSDWCRWECALMYHRNVMTKRDPNYGLVLPIRFTNASLPPYAEEVQSVNWEKYNMILERTPMHGELIEEIKAWTPGVALSVRHAPEWNEEWETSQWEAAADRAWNDKKNGWDPEPPMKPPTI